MRKLLLSALMLCSAGSLIQAQTILSEDFENGKTEHDYDRVAVGDGWTTVNSYKGDDRKFNWHNYYSNPKGEYSSATITGSNCAACDGSIFEDRDGSGPREELLITPELNLDGTYMLQFSWKVSPMNAYDNSRYDLQVRVITDDNVNGAETIFSIQNEKMLRESGVTVFPIPDWSIYTSKVDLSDFKGEKVKLAFVYKMMAPIGNIAWIDDISVSKYDAPNGPQASLNLDRYNFGQLFVGQKRYSDVITLTNTGKDGLKITGIDYPNGVSSTLDPETVNLDKYRQVNFQLIYNASLTSAASGNVVIHTNGGDVTIGISATKQVVPADSYLENFEGFFPPAGWKTVGWNGTKYALEGDQSAVGYGDLSVQTITSPRLDLTDGGNVTFTFFNQFDGQETDDPYYFVTLEVSTDGGNTWKQKWTSADYEANTIQTATVKLGYGDDNSYIRWKYPAVEYIEDEGADEHPTFYLDGVLLPHVYSMDDVPQTAKIVSPKNGEENVYPRDIKLEWEPAQFAQGYKIYLGTSSAANEQINGEDVGNVLSYVVPFCEYETEFTWKVVAYNEYGDGKAATGHFTTQGDATNTSYPYIEDFESKELPMGWNVIPTEGTYSKGWYINDYKPYEKDGKKYNVMASYWIETGTWNALVTPEFKLLEDQPMTISFVWGDEHPASLKVDDSGQVRKNNVEPNNGASETFFEILDNGEWKTLTTISEPWIDGDYKYWINEKVDLSDYVGKTVMFRWRHVAYSGKDNGGSIAHIVLEPNEAYKGEFNKSEWNAGKVNYDKATSSGDIFSITNNGGQDLIVKEATFNTPNFSTSLKAGDKIAVDATELFSIRFDALHTAAVNDPVAVEDEMTVEFEGGYKMVMPLNGIAMPLGTYYYSFEPNDLDYVWDQDMTMIDADNRPGYDFSSYWVYYSAGGTKCAFSAENDSYEHGMYGMMKPVSGMWCLVGASPTAVAPDNWIISRKLKATTISKFDFYARNWETLNSVLPDPQHHVTVYVSTGENTKTSDFTDVVMRDTEMPFLGEGEWNHYEVDLSQYAGQEIYVAVRHTATAVSNLAFFDDFCFSGFDREVGAVEDLDAAAAEANVEVYNLNGIRVAAGKGQQVIDALGQGLYIVKVDGKTYKIVK